MPFVLEPTFRFHLRCALYITLGAALATFVGATLVSLERVTQLEAGQRGSESEAAQLRQQMDRRLAEVDSRRESDTADFEQRLRVIAENQSAASGSPDVARATSPFPIEMALASVVELICIDNADRETYYTGSGTVIDDGGLIITNHHLLVSGDQSLIRFCGVGFTRDLQVPPKIEYVGNVIAVHEDNDIALLRITEHLDGKSLPAKFPAIAVTESRKASLSLRLGDPIYIGGYPGIGAETFTFTQGVVSGRVGNELIKTSALIDSGTSGGAAFDSAGRYVGMPTAAVQGEIGGSLGYLIGANIIDEFMAAFHDGKNILPPAK